MICCHKFFCCSPVSAFSLFLILAVFFPTGSHAEIDSALRDKINRLHMEMSELRSQKRYEQALKPAQQNLELLIKEFGDTAPTVAQAYSNLGLLYLDMQEYDKAEQYLMRSLKIFKKTMGLKHKNVLRALANLFLLYDTKGDLEMAQQYFDKALALDKELE